MSGALQELNAVEQFSAAALIGEGTRLLREAGIENPRAEARLLLEIASRLSRESLIANPDKALDAGAFRALLRRRTNREPMAYIRGEKEFFSLPFKVTPAVLIPRPDSECLIEAALGAFADPEAPLSVLDLGTGSGCLLLSFLSARPRARGLGIDASGAALACARENARELGLEGRAQFVCADWLSALSGSFDVILANPPYIRESEIGALEPDVARFEPLSALSGGADGFDAYRIILRGLACHMTAASLAFFEIGAGQADTVTVIAEACGLASAGTARDLAGHMRTLLFRRSGCGRDKKIVGMGALTG